MSRLNYLYLILVSVSLLALQTGCEKSTEGEHILIQELLEITFVDSETGAHLIGPDKRYDPALIKVFDQSWEDTGIGFTECQGNEYGAFYDLYRNGPEKVLSFDTTLYIQFSEHDVDTLNITYAYDKQTDYYFQKIKYNDSLYSERVKDFDCGILLYKKP